MQYTMTLNEKQLQTIQEALEVYSRLGVGQWHPAFECLPLDKSLDHEEWRCFLNKIGVEMRRFTKHEIDGYQSSLGVYGNEAPESAQIAWDIYQVVRHHLSWSRAIELGYVEGFGSPRNWDEMVSVRYDEPLPVSGESLAKIEVADYE